MPEGVTRQISPKDFFFSWGSVVAKDFAKGDAIKVIQNADDWEAYVGTGGEATLIELTDSSAIIEVNLAESSPTNQSFSAQRQLHKSRAIGPLPCMVRTTGTSVFSGAKCTCLGPPKERVIGDTVQALTWRFFVSALKRNDGFAPEV